ncbi:MAG: biopolymer transporter ExbD [Nevskiaceae bacterium]|nr:MAG: biopolymer transporter ExbD [Nevskiaceae bacterium]TBR74131.1 MAG: biopolymer transporter ExbD [Nevskiaceae bacterium]
MKKQSRVQTRRAIKRELRREAKRDIVTVNIVPMVDMFTALVFFLLLITTSVVTMRNPRSLTLPNSVSTQPPLETPVLTITRNQVLLQGQPVMTLDAVQQTAGNNLPPLATALHAVQLQQPTTPEADGTGSRGKINIMADESTPYALLKKVMATCGDLRFTDITLSVNHVPRHTS